MSELDHEMMRQLEAAEGWLGLGNWREAELEMARIPPEKRVLAIVKRVECDIRAAACDWEKACHLAQELIKSDPKHPFGYVRAAYALHELKRTQQAWDTLFPAAAMFHTEWGDPLQSRLLRLSVGPNGYRLGLAPASGQNRRSRIHSEQSARGSRFAAASKQNQDSLAPARDGIDVMESRAAGRKEQD